MSRLAILLAVTALTGLASCYSPTWQEGVGCGSGDTCPAGLVCGVDGTCRIECGPDDTCPAGLVCAVDGTCRRSADEPQPPLVDASVGVDASPPDAPDLCVGWVLPGDPDVDPCEIPEDKRDATITLTDGDYVYDTDTGELQPPSGPAMNLDVHDFDSLRVVSADAIDIQTGAVLRAVGTRPLFLVAWSNFTVAGEIDVSSQRGNSGAGAGSTACTPATIDGGDNPNGGGGAGGGGYGAGGGASSAGAGSTAGPPGAPITGSVPLRGGCSGGSGGSGPDNGAAGGPGGGAVALSARQMLAMSGGIHAGGAGGEGGAPDEDDGNGGGGGGGSGGLIWLAATSITFDAAILTANGGAGGEGASTSAGDRGDDAFKIAMPAEGGSSVGTGGDGGDATNDGAPGHPGSSRTNSSSGGGGGGGGPGIIVLRSDTPIPSNPETIISPPAR